MMKAGGADLELSFTGSRWELGYMERPAGDKFYDVFDLTMRQALGQGFHFDMKPSLSQLVEV